MLGKLQDLKKCKSMCLLNLSWKGGHAHADSVGTGGGFITNDPYGANCYDASGGYSQEAGETILRFFFALIFVTTFSFFARLELFLRLPCLIKIMEIGVITQQILLSNLQYSWENNIRIH